MSFHTVGKPCAALTCGNSLEFLKSQVKAALLRHDTHEIKPLKQMFLQKKNGLISRPVRFF